MVGYRIHSLRTSLSLVSLRLPKFPEKVQVSSLVDVIGRTQIGICLSILLPLMSLVFVFWGVEDKPLFWEQKFGFDLTILNWIHDSIPPWLAYLLKAVYLVTGAEVTAFIVAGTLGLLVWKRYLKEAAILAVCTLAILLTNDHIIKPFFLRLRPAGGLVEVVGRSFPSGHATGNLMFYFFIAYLLSAHFPKQAKYFYGLATFWILLIGIASVYIKVHWVTDIFAGYGVGYLWLTAALTLHKFTDRPLSRSF